MKITDLNGCEIEVTDLEKAIGIAEEYKEYQHGNESYPFFRKANNNKKTTKNKRK
jgi:hypothetical protein